MLVKVGKRGPMENIAAYGTLLHEEILSSEGWREITLDVDQQHKYERLLEDYGRLGVTPIHDSFSDEDIYQRVLDVESGVVLVVNHLNQNQGTLEVRCVDDTLRDNGYLMLEREIAFDLARALLKYERTVKGGL